MGRHRPRNERRTTADFRRFYLTDLERWHHPAGRTPRSGSSWRAFESYCGDNGVRERGRVLATHGSEGAHSRSLVVEDPRRAEHAGLRQRRPRSGTSHSELFASRTPGWKSCGGLAGPKHGALRPARRSGASSSARAAGRRSRHRDHQERAVRPTGSRRNVPSNLMARERRGPRRATARYFPRQNRRRASYGATRLTDSVGRLPPAEDSYDWRRTHSASSWWRRSESCRTRRGQ